MATDTLHMTDVHTVHSMQYRTIFISDVHLGYKGCRADSLIQFLKAVKCDHLFLVGDIVDVWSLKKSLFWPQAHNNVLRILLSKAKLGTKKIFIPGNHDEMFRNYDGHSFGNLHVHNQFIHMTADGKQLLLLHGDEFDSAVACSRFLSYLGTLIYDTMLWITIYINRFRRLFGWPHWSLATYVKTRLKNAMNYIASFESAAIHEAKRQGVDGVVCGHIHHASSKKIDDFYYYNTGDWVESSTALVERYNGEIELVHWNELAKDIHSVKVPRKPSAQKAA